MTLSGEEAEEKQSDDDEHSAFEITMEAFQVTCCKWENKTEKRSANKVKGTTTRKDFSKTVFLIGPNVILIATTFAATLC